MIELAEALERAAALAAMPPLERAQAELARLRRLLCWTADRWDESISGRQRLARDHDEMREQLLDVELQVARAHLVVGAKLDWLIGFLEAASARHEQLEPALERALDARRLLAEILPGAEPEQLRGAA